MLKNEEIRQKYPFFRKGLNNFEAEWITCGYIYKVCRREWKDYCDFVNIEYQKLIAHSVTRCLSLYPTLPRILQMYPASHSYFMSIRKSTVVLKRFFESSLSELCLRLFKMRYLQSLLVASNEQVQNIEKSKASFVEDRKSKNMLWQTDLRNDENTPSLTSSAAAEERQDVSSKDKIYEMADAITGGNDIGLWALWSANIPEKNAVILAVIQNRFFLTWWWKVI